MKRRIAVKISGMSCVMCVNAVEKALVSLPGVFSAHVTLAQETARVEYDDTKLSFMDIEKAIKQAGYAPVFNRALLRIAGMSCVMCSSAVEKALSGIEGIFSAHVDYASGRAEIIYDASLVSEKTVQKAVEGAGYRYIGAMFDETTREKMQKRDLFQKKIRFSLGIAAGTIAMALMYLPLPTSFPLHFFLFIMTTPVFLFISHPIFCAAFFALKNRALTMDVMYAMGIGIAYTSSVLGTFGILPHEFMYYETALFLSSFLILGRFLETKARGKTSDAIRKLMNLQPKIAHRLTDGGNTDDIKQEDIAQGDILLVKSGEIVPADGMIMSGETTIDQSMLTGEPVPVYKQSGDTVIGGTINTQGSFTMKAQRVGAETVLSQIVRLVEEAQISKPKLQKIADRVVTFFIPVVLIVAFVTFSVWFFAFDKSLEFAITKLISVLVIACPCALGLATPTAVTAGIGRGAQLGILIKHSEALELSERISTVVFDKTGTLTTGKPAVTEVHSDGMPETEILAYAAGLEMHAAHPLARAIVEYAKSFDIAPLTFETISTHEGLGVNASHNGYEICVGSLRFLEKRSYFIPENLAELSARIEQNGKTAVLMGKNGRAYGVFGISDAVKDTAKNAIAMLKAMNLSVMMITGDNQRAASAIAFSLEIPNVIAEVLPQDKAKEIQKLQQQGKAVAFVGDGINDAPALAQAEIGIAVAGGTDIALEAGSVVLLNGDLRDVASALSLGAKVTSRIRQNIFWAFAYNIILIPIAAGALYPLWGVSLRPELAGLAMALSSVTVITLSLLLMRYNPRKNDSFKII